MTMKERLGKRLNLHDCNELDFKFGTSKVRGLEMELDSDITSRGIIIQFVRDWQTYSLHEALMHLDGYEENGEVPRGCTKKLRKKAMKLWPTMRPAK